MPSRPRKGGPDETRRRATLRAPHGPVGEDAQRIAYRIASRFAEQRRHPVVDADDLHQEARIAAWEAVQEYDPAAGVRLTTHIYNRVCFALLNALHSAS